jgi:hypothetical protein
MLRQLIPHRLHYAWIVAGITFITLIVTAAVRATPSILIVPLEQEFGWSRVTISSAISINPFALRLDRPVRGRSAESVRFAQSHDDILSASLRRSGAHDLGP